MSCAQPLTRPSTRGRIGLVAFGAAALLLVPVASAQAHIHVEADAAVIGADATLTFRVPTESDTASTVKVVVTLPSDPPLLSVSPQAVAGWTAAVSEAPLPKAVVVAGTTVTRAAHQVTWTAAAGGGIPPEQMSLFGLLVEGLPDATELAFPTTQYYSDGTKVVWDQPTPVSGEEPEHPLPTLQLVHGTASAATSAPSATASVAASVDGAEAPSPTGEDTVARWLSVVAIVLSGVTLLVVLRRGSSAAAGGTTG